VGGVGAGVGDQRVSRPVEVDVAEAALFGGGGGRCLGGFVEAVGLLGGGGGAGEGVDGFELVVVGVSMMTCHAKGLSG